MERKRKLRWGEWERARRGEGETGRLGDRKTAGPQDKI
jgi:hypothetical protein